MHRNSLSPGERTESRVNPSTGFLLSHLLCNSWLFLLESEFPLWLEEASALQGAEDQMQVRKPFSHRV